jgi:hypothetical protein
MNYYEYLLSNQYACMVRDRDGIVTYSVGSGILPLYRLFSDEKDYSGMILTDKVVGIAAAQLSIRMGVASVEAVSMSRGALLFLKQNNIAADYLNLAEHIVNRSNDGLCPLEKKFSESDGRTDPIRLIEQFLIEIGTEL